MTKNKVGITKAGPASNEEPLIASSHDVGVNLRKRWALQPESAAFISWELLVLLTSILSTAFVTFQIAFKATFIALTASNYSFDAVYVVHIIVQFYVPYLKAGRYVTHKKKIKRKYATGALIIDVLSTIPFELITLAVIENVHDADWEYFIRMARINRILRFYNVIRVLGKHESKLGTYSKIIRTIKFSIVGFIIVHIMTCGWYMLACPNESESQVNGNTFCKNEHAWTAKFQDMIDGTRTTFQNYVRCFYWAAITATSTGYGDIAAQSSQEKWFSMLAMVCGIGFFFGPILGYMASSITNADSKRAKYNHRIQVIKDHLANKIVSIATQKKVNGYYEHLWNRHQGIVKDNMFHDLPITFQSEISLVNNKHVLEKAPLFKDVSVEFMRMVSLVIKPATYLPKQIIIYQDEVRQTMFYIAKGTVEVMSPSNPTKVAKVLQEGSFFGEIALLMNIPRAATCRASAYCELLILERTDLSKIMVHFPDVGRQLYATLEGRCTLAKRYIERRDKSHFKAVVGKTKFIQEDPAATYVDYEENEKEGPKGHEGTNERSRTDSISTVRRRYILSSESNILKAWKIFFASVLVMFTFAHTYVAAYMTSFGGLGYGPWFGLLYIVDLLYYTDIVFHLRTAIKDDTGAPISDPEIILRAYVRSARFWFDLLSILPIELPFICMSDPRLRFTMVTFVRTNRLLKLHDVFDLLKGVEHNILANITLVRIVKLALLIGGTTHLCACIWFFQACWGTQCNPDSWTTEEMYTVHTPMSEIYITSIYWAAATMTSTGYGDITASTTLEEGIAIIVFLVGLLIYGFCLSNIAAILTNKLYHKVQFKGRINAVVDFIKEQRLSGELVERVERYLGIVWRTHKGEAMPGCQLLMADMPNRLQLDVYFEEMQEVIGKVPIFRNTDTYFIKLLASKLVTYVLGPGDMVVYRGDVGREMYILRRGLVEVLSQDRKSILATLGPGGYFGEVGLIFGESRTADVRTKTYCEVAMLRKSDLDEVLKTFPLIEQQFRATSQNETILNAIKTAAHKPADPQLSKAAKRRIQLIEQTKDRRSKSVFQQWKTGMPLLSDEEVSMDKELQDEVKRPYEKLGCVARCLSKLLMKETFLPEGRMHLWLNHINSAIVLAYFVTNALQMGFFEDNNYIMVINYCFDAYFILWIYLQFHVAFPNKDGVLITHPIETSKNYLKNRFVIDFITTFPFELFGYFAYIISVSNALGNANAKTVGLNLKKKLIQLLRYNRLLGFLRVHQYFKYLEEPINAPMSLMLVKFVIFTYLLIHWKAVIWFMNACSDYEVEDWTCAQNDTICEVKLHKMCAAGSWMLKAKLHENENVSGKEILALYMSKLTQYMTSFYWSATTGCSVGYGDITAYLPGEKGIASLCMVVGVVYFGFIIATVTASLANADAARARYKAKVDTVDRFLAEQQVEASLAKRVREYYRFLWARNKGVNLETLFQGLPNSLQADITLSLYKDIIESVPLFQGTELGFTKMLSLYIQPLLLPKGEYIVRKGDIGEEMFFINKGYVEVVSEHSVPIVFDTMEPGRFFGEISTIFSCPRTASVRTQTNVDLFVLKKKHLDIVLGHYPHIRKQIMETAEERQRMVQERAKVAAAKKAEEERQKAAMLIAAMRRFSIAAAERSSVTGLNETDKLVPTMMLVPEEEDESDDGDDVMDLNESKIGCATVAKQRMNVAWNKLIGWLSFAIRINSKLHLWRHVNIVLILLHYLSTTYMASFQHHVQELFVFNLCVELSCYVEVFLKAHMAYLNEAGDEVTEPKEIWRNYFHGEFKYDMLMNSPFWLCAFGFPDWRHHHYFFSLLQVLRLKRVKEFFQRSLTSLDANVLLLRMMDSITKIIVMLQLSSCIWFLIACQGNHCSEKSWVHTRITEEASKHPNGTSSATSIHDDLTPGDALSKFGWYTDSVYWALATMTSTGYGDISATPGNNIEMGFAALIMILGKIQVGFVLGNIASTMANMETLRVLYEERYNGVIAHMTGLGMPAPLQRRVVQFFQYMWQRNKGSSNDGIFDTLPSCLHAELCLDLTGDSMKQVPIFQECELPFIRALCTEARLVQFQIDEYVYRKGDIGHEMYFIKSGTVEILNEDGTVDEISSGEFFGDECLVRHAPRWSSARALTHVDMYTLKEGDMDVVFAAYPEEALRVRKNSGVHEQEIRRVSLLD